MWSPAAQGKVDGGPESDSGGVDVVELNLGVGGAVVSRAKGRATGTKPE